MNEPIASRAKKIGALRSNTVPIPFEHLYNNNWSPPGAGKRLCRVVQLVVFTFICGLGKAFLGVTARKRDKREY